MGCGLKQFPHSNRPLFFFLMTSPSSHPSTVVGSLISVLWEPAVLFFHGAQGATQDSWNRTEPGLTHCRCSLPAPWSSEAQSPFPRPIVITKDLLSLQNVLNSKARRKQPSHLIWEAKFELGRNGWGLYWERPRWKGRQTATWSSKSAWTSRCYHNHKLLHAVQNGVVFKMLYIVPL